VPVGLTELDCVTDLERVSVGDAEFDAV
jgi:hypothetical protein